MKVDLSGTFQRKSDVELIVIAMDEGSNYTSDARETASNILLSRHPGKWNVQAVCDDLFQQLDNLANKCSICQHPEVASRIAFKLCTTAVPNEAGLLAGMGSLLVLGVGFVQTKRSSISLELKLCSNCLKQRTVKTKKGTQVRISVGDCISHPLYEFYQAQGYCDVGL